MSETNLVCPKCSGEMEQGFVIEHSEAGYRVTEWAAGAPKARWILPGAKLPKEHIPIGSFRCSSCGFLESYAREEFRMTDA